MRDIKKIRVVKLMLNDIMMPASNGDEYKEGYAVEITMANGLVIHNECSFCSRNFEKQFAKVVREAERLSKLYSMTYENTVK